MLLPVDSEWWFVWSFIMVSVKWFVHERQCQDRGQLFMCVC